MVDDKSLAELGSLPLDRSHLAQAVAMLRQDRARLIGFDLLLAEPRNAQSDQVLAAEIKRAGNVFLPIALPADKSNRAQQPGTVPDYLSRHVYQGYTQEEGIALIPHMPQEVLAPLEILGLAAKGLGHVTAMPGPDGSLRFDLPMLWYLDELYPSLAIAIAAAATGSSWKEVSAAPAHEIRTPGLRVPLDSVSRQWVNYYGPAGTFPTYSLVDYLKGRLPEAVFKGRIVLIGQTALGTADRHFSPFDPALPGVERLATVIDNVVASRCLSRPSWAAPVEILGIILLPYLVVWLVYHYTPARAFSIILLLAALLVLGGQAIFVVRLEYVGLAFPMLALVLSSGLAIGLRAWYDERSRRTAEIKLRASEERYALAAKGANDGLWDWDISSEEVFYSERWRQLMGVSSDKELRGIQGWLGLLDQVERERFKQELDAHLCGGSGQFYYILRAKIAGESRWLLARGVATLSAGTPTRMAGSLTDITEQKRLEKQIAYDALHDRLTGLANRDLFNDRVSQLLSRGGTTLPASVGVMLLDVDGFRSINEKYGQVSGNNLLREIAFRIRPNSWTEGMLARVGADQFAVAFEGKYDGSQAKRLRELLMKPFDLGGGLQGVSVSIAVAHTQQGLSSAEDLLNAATLALANSKQQGRGQVRVFDPAEQELENNRHWLHRNIDAALLDGAQFRLFYQPFICLVSRRLLGFEALIRWFHPERGLIPPGDFIPYAEQSGQINAIGLWTLQQAVNDLLDWDAKGFKGEVAVNLSGRQFSDMDLPSECEKILDRLGGDKAHRFKLEVTESMAMSNPQRATDVLMSLTAMGFKISIDDFGTGYSSLAYLHRFPFDTLKVDRSFVCRLESGRDAREIVRTIASLGGALGKQVLAEGVETEEQALLLRDLGVHAGQGWLFAKALPAEEAIKVIEADLKGICPQ